MTQQLIDPSVAMSAIVDHAASAPVPTEHGTFDLHVYRSRQPTDHGLSNDQLALVLGDVAAAASVPVRVHSECITSEVFGSLKCDCKGQLDRAMAEVASRGVGVIIYLRQEGRGIGLANKIRAYALQAQGADTIEANELLHLPVDARQYDVAVAMLRHLGVGTVELMTNNPEKVRALRRLGLSIQKRIPMVVAANPHSADYLAVKKQRMQHELPSGVFHQPPVTDGDPPADDKK
ncbi:MAG TPA: GTP cyclohydrolase II [Polyangiaceae bacterium]|nr:GTP cyclohydrolase II [Polyangiaceae bacterium]HMR76022.1 GTP cyclohydrolase II [Polyangiaceae bacterium]